MSSRQIAIAAFIGAAGLAVVGWGISMLLDDTSPFPSRVAPTLVGTGLVLSLAALVLLFVPVDKRRPQAPPDTGDASGIEVKFSRNPPHSLQVANREQYRLGIYNHGPRVATNVKLWLDDIAPRPRDTRFEHYADFPYSRQPVDEGPEDRNINPNDEMLFQILSSWVGGRGPQAGLQIGDIMLDNLGPTSFLIEPDEQ